MGYIKLNGPVPGPRSRALLERRLQAVLAGVSTLHPLFAAEASGSTITDVDGNCFLDFAGGIGVMNTGHADPAVTRAIAEQAARFTHVCFQVLGYDGYVAVAEALVDLAPGAFQKRALLLSTGAEAIENAVKIARGYTRRGAVLCFEHGFHGRTLLALTLTGKAAPYKPGFGPFAPEVYRLPYPYAYREPQPPAAFDEALRTIVAPTDLAAVIIEPVLGEGGFVVPPPGFLQALRAFADRHGIVLIIDEVQSGFGRTGTMFACEQAGVVPDLLTMAKSLAGGMPLSAVVGRADIMDAIPPGGVGGTFGGNPVSCAAALESIAIIRRALDSGHVARLGARLRERLEAMAAVYPLIGDVRGLGAMQAIELVRRRETKEPAARETAEIVRRARARGLLLFPAGTLGNVIRFLLPLTTPLDALDEGLDVLAQVFEELPASQAD